MKDMAKTYFMDLFARDMNFQGVRSEETNG